MQRAMIQASYVMLTRDIIAINTHPQLRLRLVQ